MILKSTNVLAEAGANPATIQIRNGRIEDIGPYDDFADIDYGDLAIMAGLVDSHVHVNEPGRTEWEGFETATRAAAAGGVTTIVDMPLNSIPATTAVAGLEKKLEAARDKLHVDAAFWGGVVPGNTGDMARLWDGGGGGLK